MQWGDSLYLIAQRFNVTIAELQEVNGIYGDLIYAGEYLYIPESNNTTSTLASRNLNSRGGARTGNTQGINPGQEINLLARMIHAEAESEPYLGKVAVAAVILNRVYNYQFPNSISDVIFQPGEFEPLLNNRFWQVSPSADSYAAARDALSGFDPTNGALYFYNPSLSSSWWIFTRQVIGQIGKHLFAI